MGIRPIRSDKDHAEALKEIDRLWGAPKRTPKGEKLDVLLTLVDSYERTAYPIAPPDPIDAIRFRLEQQGLKPSALVGVIGSRSRVYEVLRGARPLTLPMIRRLHQRLEIPAEVLIQPTTLKRRRAA